MSRICDFCEEPILRKEMFWTPQDFSSDSGMHGRPCWRRNQEMPRSFTKEVIDQIKSGWEATDNALIEQRSNDA